MNNINRNQDCRVGYQGVEGAYSNIVSKKIFGNNNLMPYLFFEEVFQAVENKEISYGVLPFENSYTGEVGEVFDLLYQYDCKIIKMYDLKITHNLLGIAGSKFEEIEQIYSHQQALSQCHDFLKGYSNLELIPFGNTALAAKYISEERNQKKACIASKQTAELYQLDILATNINTSKENTTRFVVISKREETIGNHCSMMFTVENQVGSLGKMIQWITKYGFNMESIKSKPRRDLPWQYYFYVEIEGKLDTEQGKALLKELEYEAATFKILGSYHKGEKL